MIALWLLVKAQRRAHLVARDTPLGIGGARRLGWIGFSLVLFSMCTAGFVVDSPRATAVYLPGLGAALAFAAAVHLRLRGRAVVPRPESFVELVSMRFARHRLARGASLVLAAMIEVALWGGVIEWALGVSHRAPDVDRIYLGPTWPFLLGTDEVGHDVFTRLLFGGQISLAVGLVSALSAAAVGTVVGLTAGYFGGWWDTVAMRFVDAMLSIPVLPLMIVFSALSLDKLAPPPVVWWTVLLGAFGWGLFSLLWSSRRRRPGPRPPGGMAGFALLYASVVFGVVGYAVDWSAVVGGGLGSVVKIILIIVLFGWMTVARLARAAALTLRNMEFVTAARALGAGHGQILLQHILPGALAPVIVAATLEVGAYILYEAALSYLGLGVQPPVPSWGNMLNNGLEYIRTAHAHLAFWPGLLILVTVVCFNFFGDGLRDALDPHQVMKRTS